MRSWTLGLVALLGLLLQVSCSPLHRRFHRCLNDDVCSCKNRIATCSCNIGVSANIDVAPITLLEDVETFIIRGHQCDVVLHATAFTHIPLKSVNIEGVGSVDIRMAAFFKVLNTQAILIADTKLHISPYAFNTMSNVSLIELRNVTIANVSHEAFTEMSTIGKFQIVNSRIDAIHKHAFTNASDIETFAVVNTSIGQWQTASLKMRRVHHFLLDNVTVGAWHSGAIHIKDSHQILLKSSTIESFPERAIVGQNISTFRFSNNMVYMLKQKAFVGLENVTTAVVSSNYFDYMEEDYSLISSSNTWAIEGNRFNCEADNLCWLFQDSAQPANSSKFYRSNFCQNTAWTSTTNTSLDNLSSFLDDEDVCNSDRSSGDGSRGIADATKPTQSSTNFTSSSFTFIFFIVFLQSLINSANL